MYLTENEVGIYLLRKSCQFLIGNVSRIKMSKSNYEKYAMCQFLIGNVSRIDMKKFINCMTYACQFLIGNVSQLI